MGCGYVHCHETPPVYALIDVNSMYCSCEEAFMVRKLEKRFKNTLTMKPPVRNAVMT